MEDAMLDGDTTGAVQGAEGTNPHAAVAVDPTVSADLDQAVQDHELEGAETQPEAIQPPASLNAEDKAFFASQPPEVQKWLADKETVRARQVTEATMRASERERAAQAVQQRAEVEAKAVYAQQLNAFIGQYQPQQPDPSRYADINEYNRDNAIYQHQMGQFQQLVQQVQGLAGEARQGMDGLTEQQRNAEARALHAAFPEWFDEAKGAEHKARLTAVGSELGYTPELMAQAGSQDVLALRKAADWKDKAEKYDRLMATRMASVRAGKGSVPPNARAAATGAQSAPASVAASMYPNDVRR